MYARALSTLPPPPVIASALDITSELRLLDLGFADEEASVLTELVSRDAGLVLLVGGPREGKTTTLEAALGTTLERAEVRPYALEGAERPVVAAHAIEAARERVVLATIEASSGTEALATLRRAGLSLLPVLRVLAGVVVQRLAARVCPECAAPYEPSRAERDALGRAADGVARFARGAGCDDCAGSGTAGRVPVAEILTRPALPGSTTARRLLSDSLRAQLAAGCVDVSEALRVLEAREVSPRRRT